MAFLPIPIGLAAVLACATPQPNPGESVDLAEAIDWIHGDLHVLDDDGAWCWFEGERAVMRDGKLLVGTVSAGSLDPARPGDINVLVHDWEAGSTRIVELHDRLERDDHNSPSLTWLPDGRLFTMYAKHGSDSVMRWRMSHSADLRQWSAESTLNVDTGGRGLTYSNTYWLPELGAGKPGLINLFRGMGWNPNATFSIDFGASWSAPRPLLVGPGRPYMRYVSDGQGTVHFATSEAHPRNFDTGIRHGALAGVEILNSAGKPIGSFPNQPAKVSHLTQVYQGTPDRVAWCSDIRLDGDGSPVIVYSVQHDSAGIPVGEGGQDCRYRYARLRNGVWNDFAVAHAGHRLYSREDDYTGLISINPIDVSDVVFSSSADPVTGVPLVSASDNKRHWELFRGRTRDGGASWSFAPLTQNSTVDNIRPIFAVGAEGNPVVTWLRGEYTTYQQFDMAVVALALTEK